MTVTPEMIAAYADGELAGEERQRVEAAIAADGELARQVERHRRLRAMLSARYAPITAAPVPDRLTEQIASAAKTEDASGEVLSLAQARARRGLAPAVRRWLPVAGPAIAASLVLALWQPWQRAERPGYAPAELASLLDNRLVSEQRADAQPRVLLSFAARDGRLCRAWRDSGRGGIACRDSVGWKIERKLLLDSVGTAEYRQAGSDTDLLAAAQTMAAGEALDADEERRAKTERWIRPRD
jgi:hypothetical protein